MSKRLFKPAWWLPGPHLQTLWPTLCRKNIRNLELERERLELPDGDFVDLDWVGKSGPIVIILHGLEGSVHSPYAQGMLHAIVGQGWRGLFIHFRGCSGEPNRLPRSYHSGETQDLAWVVQAILKREPQIPIAAVGFSLGGNVLLKWLGETGSNNPLAAAVGVSVPFELTKASKHIQRGFSKLYQWHLLRCIRRRLKEKFAYQTLVLPYKSLQNVKTLWELDDIFTAPVHGFSSVDEYYSLSSSRQYLGKICVPTLLVQSKDDPFYSQDLLPNSHELSKQIQLELTTSGGHVGFISGNIPGRSEYWLEKRVPEFFKAYFK